MPRPGAPASVSRTWVEIVGIVGIADDAVCGRSGVSGPVLATYPPGMGELKITVGDDLHFTARWEPDAPATIEAFWRMLPIDSPLIHCCWSGESTSILYAV